MKMLGTCLRCGRKVYKKKEYVQCKICRRLYCSQDCAIDADAIIGYTEHKLLTCRDCK